MNNRKKIRFGSDLLHENLILKSNLLFLVLAAFFCSGPVWAEQHHAGLPKVLGFDLTEGWLDDAACTHFTPLGTPLIHPFRTEPAFTNRDFLLDYSLRRSTGTSEHEIEAELEWALTRRLGLVIEFPYSFINTDDEGSRSGSGDLAVSPRFLLAEYENSLLAFNLEIETPTGDSDRGFGHGQAFIAPSLSGWFDLGNWWALNAQCGSEHATESGDSEFFFRTALIHTFAPDDHHDAGRTEHDHIHGFPPGLLSLIMELDGSVALSGEEDGRVPIEAIIGACYSLSELMDLRVGYMFPLTTPTELNNGLTCGLIWHF
jgi:hypothetical protein